MARYIDADKVHESIETLQIALESNNDRIWEKNKPYYKGLAMARGVIDGIPIADVAPRAEVFEEVDKFRADLMDKFIDLCRGNDYNKLTLLKIGDVLDEIYDGRIAELKKKYTEGQK